MSSWAKPGVKCVCVKVGDWTAAEWHSRLPAYREVLTIKSVYIDEGIVGLCFEGISGRFNARVQHEQGFNAVRFRPLAAHTQEQDLEHFLPLLNTVEEPA